jgi:DNA-binding XRE family transcriptional regulator
MKRGVPVTATEEQNIIAALEKTPHASLVARKIGRSFSTVWRVAERAGIELTAGREAKGYKRLPAARRAEIAEVRRAMPDTTQEEVARRAGVSRATVSRLMRSYNRRREVLPGG